jgi:curved DNA-binding protein CbpA
MMLNAYELMGVDQKITLEELKEAFRRKARIYHPDQGGNAEDFIELKKAFELLSDPQKRTFMATRPMFKRPTVRLQPSLSQSTSQLFENLALLEDQLKSIVNR